MKAKSTLPGAPAFTAAQTAPAATDVIWFKLSEQPLLRIGWVALAGQQLFASLGHVEISRIWVCRAPLGADIAISSRFQQTLDTIASYGAPRPQLTIKFDTLLPGYQATVRQYSHPRWQCLLVEDWAGRYLYMWASDAVLAHPAQLLTLKG